MSESTRYGQSRHRLVSPLLFVVTPIYSSLCRVCHRYLDVLITDDSARGLRGGGAGVFGAITTKGRLLTIGEKNAFRSSVDSKTLVVVDSFEEVVT